MDGSFATLLVNAVPASIMALVAVALILWHMRECKINRRLQHDSTNTNSQALVGVTTAVTALTTSVDKLVDKTGTLSERVSALEAVDNLKVLREIKQLPSG